MRRQRPTSLKSYLTKVITGAAAIFAGVWATFVATLDWIGRLAVGDAWASIAKKMPEWIHVVTTTSPWVPGATCVGLALILVYLNWPLEDERSDFEPPGSAETEEHPVAVTSATVSDMIVVDGARGQPPSFRGRFAENGSNAVFYLEYSSYHPSVMGRGWTLPRKFEIYRQTRYSRGLSVTFPIVSLRENQDGGFWKLGLSDDDTDMINPTGSYKGRISMLDACEREQHVYFILVPHGREMPTVLGQHMFDHILEWVGARTGTGDPESLFT